MIDRLPARIRSKITHNGECWEWTAFRRQGYGRIQWQGKMSQAHRIVYELLVGPIPEAKDWTTCARTRNVSIQSILNPSRGWRISSVQRRLAT